VLLWRGLVIKHRLHGTLQILICQFSKIFFLRIREGLTKFGIYICSYEGSTQHKLLWSWSEIQSLPYVLIYKSNNYCLPDSEMVSFIVASSSLPLLSSVHKLTSNVCASSVTHGWFRYVPLSPSPVGQIACKHSYSWIFKVSN
jgi:hypothetical protein